MMHAKTMEGLMAASINIQQTDGPMRVYREAKQRGDYGKMEQAMGYVTEFACRAVDGKELAEEEMKEEAKEAREEKQQRLEEAIERAREERQENEVQTKAADTKDVVEISQEGQIKLETSVESAGTGTEPANADKPGTSAIYTKAGTVQMPGKAEKISVCL